MIPPCPCPTAREWRRRYLHAEWRRRRQQRLTTWMARTMAKRQRQLKSEIHQLTQRLERAQRTIRAHELTISAQHNTLNRFKLPAYASFRLCKAHRHETCPLSLQKIRSSSLPFAPNAVYNPARPLHTCAELACGHRFSSMWLIYHFVRNSTFRCPVCMTGLQYFRFRTVDLPEHLLPVFQSALA
jgi:hypothetical protein